MCIVCYDVLCTGSHSAINEFVVVGIGLNEMELVKWLTMYGVGLCTIAATTFRAMSRSDSRVITSSYSYSISLDTQRHIFPSNTSFNTT